MDTDASVTGGALTDAASASSKTPSTRRAGSSRWIHYLDPHAEYVAQPVPPIRRRHAGACTTARSGTPIVRSVAWSTSLPISLGEQTAIILTSDHGEAFAEHRMIRHGVELWEELVRVPLVIYVRGSRRIGWPNGEARSISVPTLLDLFERDPPTGGTGSFDFVSGTRSLTISFYPRATKARPVTC